MKRDARDARPNEAPAWTVTRAWWRVSQIAQALGVRNDTVRNWCRTGKLPAERPGGSHYRVRGEELQRALREWASAPRVLAGGFRGARGA